MLSDPMQTDPSKLRELASWYRDFAERAGDPTIWEGRLRTAEALEAQAEFIERGHPTTTDAPVGS